MQIDKRTRTEVQVTSWTSTWVITVYISGKCYNYYNVPYKRYKQLQQLAESNRLSELFRLLKQYAQSDRKEVNRWTHANSRRGNTGSTSSRYPG